jgi:hypothetical protein
MYNCPGYPHHGGEYDHQHRAGQLRGFSHLASPNIADARRYSPRRTLDLGIEFHGLAGFKEMRPPTGTPVPAGCPQSGMLRTAIRSASDLIVA